MKRIAIAFAAALLSGQAVAQTPDFPQAVMVKSPATQGGGTTLVMPFTNGGEVVGQFNQSSSELIEGFDTSTLNITNNWLAPTTGGGGNAVAATNAAADTVLSTGTTANGWSKLQTIKVFTEDNPGYQFLQTNVNISPALSSTSNSCMFFGFGTVPANPVCGAMLTNGAGFETTAAGALNAVTYASGTRLLIANLSVVQGNQPTVTQTSGSGQALAFAAGCSCTPAAPFADTGSHKVLIYMRGDNIIFAVEGVKGQAIPVAYTVAGSAGLDVNAVPVTFLAVAGPTGPSPAATLQINQVTIARTSGKAVSVPPVVSGASETSHVFKAYPGALISAYAFNLSATAGMFLIFNSASVPADGAVTPVECIPIAANGTASVSYRSGPHKHLNTGISAALSTAATCFTKTTGLTTGFISGDVQ
jgi:hypothetical protein